MRLSDIMSSAGLTSWAEVGLIISFITFVGIAAYVWMRRGANWDRARYMPLDDDGEYRGTAR
jgi:cbb3-type cytochrome oxidase subunit 3